MRRVTYCLMVMALVWLTGCGVEPSVDRFAQAIDIREVEPAKIHPHIWPKQLPVMKRDDAVEQKISTLLQRMSLEEKVGQIIQADIHSVTPDDAKKYNLGAVLNGGNSAPQGDNRAPPMAWLALADQFWLASTDTSDGGVGVPVLWGTDAVHGHNNIIGATIFPHNIGLGAANDPDLMYGIGRITAIEMLVTGLDWTFAPTIAVARDDRWGRTYESYSEHPTIIASYAGRLVQGLQGTLGTDDFLNEDHLIATAKHFIGDGGTNSGKDQGDNTSSEVALRDIQGAGYPVAIKSGVQVVMASFNSWHGRKMHAHKELLSDVLVGRMGFDGFVVGDWNGHGQVTGCTNVSCAAAFNNGLDMFMAPDSWKSLYINTLGQVKSGEISQRRLDQAVARILRVKLRAGLFTAGLPSTRKYAGRYELLAAPAHRAVAREAVRKSLVLLKNEKNVLPLSPASNVLIAGDGANNIGKQSGGWTLSWQGVGNSNVHFPQGTSIYQGVEQRVRAAGGTVQLSETGDYQNKPDVALVVFGEDPYAEFQGDKPHLDLQSDTGLKLLRKLKAEGITTVAIFISGRAMWVNPEINAADAFVAAWLPGTEGGGVADVLFRKSDGSVNYDFSGKLSFSWPNTASQTAVNVGDTDYDPLFAYGYGLTYSDTVSVKTLSETPRLDSAAEASATHFFNSGDPVAPWRLVIEDNSGMVQVIHSIAVSPTGALTAASQDHKAQEDTRLFIWVDKARLSVEGEPIDLSQAFNRDMAMEITYNVVGAKVGDARLSIGCGETCAGALNIAKPLAAKLNLGWQTARIKLSCFSGIHASMERVSKPFEINATGPLKLQVSSIKLVKSQQRGSCTL